MTVASVPTDRGDSCPGCGSTSGVQPCTGAPPRVQAWSCATCGMEWVTSVVNPHLRSAYLSELGAAVEEIGRLRAALRGCRCRS
ncbi:MAG: hypothetical protein ACRDSR_21885 [Pseudonocardiaceae bacterium]